MSFSRKTFDFLFINKMNDSREWFNEHRDEYEENVLTPMRELVTELTPSMLAIDSQMICEPKVNKSISRIFRDTRFSHDKSIFRDVIWCHFMRDKKAEGGVPGFFFEISPRIMRYGCGYYNMGNETADVIRKKILNKDSSFEKARKAFEKQNIFHLEDSRYKRSKFSRQPENIRLWLDQRNICAITDCSDYELLFSGGMAKKLSEDFRHLVPLYNFLLKARNTY